MLTPFAKNVLNILAIPLLWEIIASLWIVVTLYDYSKFYLLEKALVFFNLLTVMFLVSKFPKQLKKDWHIISLLFICRFVRLTFISQKFATYPRTCHYCFLKCIIPKWALNCPYVTFYLRKMNIKHFFKYFKEFSYLIFTPL